MAEEGGVTVSINPPNGTAARMEIYEARLTELTSMIQSLRDPHLA